MRWITRSFIGLFLLGLTIGLLVMAAGNVFRASQEMAERGNRARPTPEREYAVNVDVLTAQTVAPVMTVFGTVESARSLEVRAATGGRLVRMADGFRDGGAVDAGELLFEIDPADAQAALDLARTELADAQADATEAARNLELAIADRDAAQVQRSLRARALERQQDLLNRRVGTEAAVETAEIALAGIDQTLVGREQALAAAEARIDRTEIAVSRREISVKEAERALAETRAIAEFDGLLSEVSAVPGRLVNANEKLGTLIDATALELAFRVSNAQFSRLIDDAGRLRPVPVEAVLSLEDLEVSVSGVIDRVGAEVGQGQTGREVFAKLTDGGLAALRPGDFLTVTIMEPELSNVAVIEASASTNDGRILLLADDGRLEEVLASIERRQGDALIVSDVPMGREYVTQRIPQLGPGVKVRPVRPGAVAEAPAMIKLDDERRARLIAAVEGNTRMPADARTRVLERLAQDEVPLATVERIEARMGGAPAPAAQTAETSDTIVPDPDRRARLIAFVEGNSGMPGDVKTRILAQLNEDAVPVTVIERLESRMGG